MVLINILFGFAIIQEIHSKDSNFNNSLINKANLHY